jgi:hypothetical protein
VERVGKKPEHNKFIEKWLQEYRSNYEKGWDIWSRLVSEWRIDPTAKFDAIKEKKEFSDYMLSFQPLQL